MLQQVRDAKRCGEMRTDANHMRLDAGQMAVHAVRESNDANECDSHVVGRCGCCGAGVGVWGLGVRG